MSERDDDELEELPVRDDREYVIWVCPVCKTPLGHVIGCPKMDQL